MVENSAIPSFSLATFGERTTREVTMKLRFNNNTLQQATQITTYSFAEPIKIVLEWNDVPIRFSAPESEIIYQKPEEKVRDPNSSALPSSF